MNEDKIREMIKDIVINGAEYEVKKCNRECSVPNDGLYCDCHHKKWVLYKLGEEIHSDWEYRKVEKWYVIHEGKTENGDIVYCRQSTFEKHYISLNKKIFFKGTEEECKQWIEEHTKKTWLEEAFPYPKNGDVYEWCVANSSRNGASEVCKNILEEVKIKNIYLPFGNRINYFALEEIINDLGVEV